MSVESYPIDQWVDSYFLRTRKIIEKFGDADVTYAVFMRRPVICAIQLAVDWLKEQQAARQADFRIKTLRKEGSWVGAGLPLMYIEGKFSQLVDLETQLLQRIGPSCVAAYNAFQMCAELPQTEFLAMDARHCAGEVMSELMSYAASIGSQRAKTRLDAKGFIGCATNAGAKYFGKSGGLGTMPHALVGYANSTLEAARMFHETFPDEPLTVLVDYFGQEIADSLALCEAFPKLVEKGHLRIRLDTIGGRYCELLNMSKSYAVLDRHCPDAIKRYLTEKELQHLIGPGVSAAAIWHLRETLDAAGFHKVPIVASSGFTPEKCRIMAFAKAPVATIGTGSFLPQIWSETYATADIISYDGVDRVKVGREFLFSQSEGE